MCFILKGVPLENILKLTANKYNQSGSTALYDAIAKCVNNFIYI